MSYTTDLHSTEIGLISAALSKAQSAMKHAVKESSNPHFKSRYADLANCIDACREVLGSHDLSLTQSIAIMETGSPVLITMIAHKSGQWLKSICPLINERNTCQSFGSAVTYMRRYSLCAMLNISADDDDGSAASAPATIGPQQIEAVYGYLALSETSKQEAFWVWMKNKKFNDVKDITLDQYPIIIKALTTNKEKKSEGEQE